MKLTYLQVSILLPALFLPNTLALSNTTQACLDNCMQTATQPCDHDSLGKFANCINTECVAANIDSHTSSSIAITPKKRFSCQDSFIPGSEDTSPPLQLPTNGDCANSPYNFRSFVASTNSTMPKDSCRMNLFQQPNCAGNATVLGVTHIKTNACTFQSGKSMNLDCDDPQPQTHAAYIANKCANSTSRKTTASGGPKPSTQRPTTSPSPGIASNEHDLNPSLAAMVAVIAAALAIF